MRDDNGRGRHGKPEARGAGSPPRYGDSPRPCNRSAVRGVESPLRHEDSPRPCDRSAARGDDSPRGDGRTTHRDGEPAPETGGAPGGRRLVRHLPARRQHRRGSGDEKRPGQIDPLVALLRLPPGRVTSLQGHELRAQRDGRDLGHAQPAVMHPGVGRISRKVFRESPGALTTTGWTLSGWEQVAERPARSQAAGTTMALPPMERVRPRTAGKEPCPPRVNGAKCSEP